MKMRDRRIVTIQLPETEDREAIDFDIGFKDLANTLKSAKENGWKKIKFNIGGKIVEVDFLTLKKVYEIAKEQFCELSFAIPRNLQSYLIDLSKNATIEGSEKISYRDEEISKLWTCIISNKKSNAIIVGEQGVGKTTMALEVVRQLKTKEAPQVMKNYRVLQLNTTKLLDIKSDFKIEIIVNRILKFLYENNNRVILYIDDLIHMKYDIRLAKMLTYCLKEYNLKMISCISLKNFEEFFEEDYTICKYLNPIYLEEPDIEEIYPMLKTRIKSMQKKYNIKISNKMIRFAIFTGYHLSSSNSVNPESSLDIINFALADARRNEQKEVTKSNILSYYYIDFKLAKKTEEDEKWITAYHEVGHYLVEKMSPHIKGTKNAFVSILPIEGALGLTANYCELGKQLTVDKEFFIDVIADCLGGRIGESLYTNTFSSGASQDLSQANSMAEKVILSYGLSSRESEKNKSYTLGGGMYIKDYLLTDELRKEINTEISELIDESYKRAEKIINENKELLEEIVIRLLEEGVLMGDELQEICDTFKSKNLIS